MDVTPTEWADNSREHRPILCEHTQEPLTRKLHPCETASGHWELSYGANLPARSPASISSDLPVLRITPYAHAQRKREILLEMARELALAVVDFKRRGAQVRATARRTPS